MNSIERVLAALTFGRTAHGKPDRVPVLPVPLMQGALIYHCTVQEYFGMPADRIAAAQRELNQLLGGVPDAVAGFPHVVEDVTAFGVDLKFPYENSSPTIDGMRINDFSEIQSLRCPAPESSPVLRKTLETLTLLRSTIGREKLVVGACIAPFSLPSMLMGTSRWMRLLLTPELRQKHLARLLGVCQEFVTKWTQLQFQAGAHVVVLADGMASSTILSRERFAEFAAPVIKEAIRTAGGPVIYEPVGCIEPSIDLCGDLGAIALLIGSEDNIASCKKKLAGKAALIGNLNNIKLRRWSPARVELQTKRALALGKPGYGFAVANQGPEIPFDCTLEQVAAMVRTVAAYGSYEPAAAISA